MVKSENFDNWKECRIFVFYMDPQVNGSDCHAVAYPP